MTAEGLSFSHFTILCALDEFGDMSQSELAGRTQHNRGHLVGFLDELESQKLLSRSTDPTDRRRNVVTLSANGQKLAARARQAALVSEDHLLAPLTESQKTTVISLLQQILSEQDGGAQ